MFEKIVMLIRFYEGVLLSVDILVNNSTIAPHSKNFHKQKKFVRLCFFKTMRKTKKQQHYGIVENLHKTLFKK